MNIHPPNWGSSDGPAYTVYHGPFEISSIPSFKLLLSTKAQPPNGTKPIYEPLTMVHLLRKYFYLLHLYLWRTLTEDFIHRIEVFEKEESRFEYTLNIPVNI